MLHSLACLWPSRRLWNDSARWPSSSSRLINIYLLFAPTNYDETCRELQQRSYPSHGDCLSAPRLWRSHQSAIRPFTQLPINPSLKAWMMVGFKNYRIRIHIFDALDALLRYQWAKYVPTTDRKPVLRSALCWHSASFPAVSRR